MKGNGLGGPKSAEPLEKRRLAAALSEIEKVLAIAGEAVDPAKAAERARFMKTMLPMHGLTVPQIRKLARQGFSFSTDPPDEVLSIWSHVWREARNHEGSLLAIYYLESLKPLPDPAWFWPHVAGWAGQISCWDQSDGLSGIYSRLLECAPDLVYPDLTLWNRSDNPWERRQSLVSLIYYYQVRTTLIAPAKVFSLVKARLDDPEYYVQKGLGWCLREAYNAWPDRTLEFLHSHGPDLAPAAWQAATEKIPADFKTRLKERRLAARRSGGGNIAT